MDWWIEHFSLYIYGKPIKLPTDHQALEPLLRRNRSTKTYTARLTRWLDRLAHFSINVRHTTGKYIALTVYLSRTSSSPPQADAAYDEDFVINNITPHYKFVTKNGCLNNHSDHSQSSQPTFQHTWINKLSLLALMNWQKCCINWISSKENLSRDARAIDNFLEIADSSAETRNLIARWKEIVKPGIFRQSGCRWKTYYEPRFLRNERRIIEEQLQQTIRNVEGGQRIQPQGFTSSER